MPPEFPPGDMTQPEIMQSIDSETGTMLFGLTITWPGPDMA